jgi:hypothetical protein
VVDANGRSRAYLNGSPVTVQQLREVAESLVDIHGQHAHQSLLRSEAQRALLDAHARLQPLLADVAAAWRSWREARTMLDAASSGLEALAPSVSNWTGRYANCRLSVFRPRNGWRLNEEHKRLAHATSLVEGAQFSLQVLAEGDAACEAQVAAVANRLEGLSEYDPALSEVAILVESARTELSEAISALRRYADRVELDPRRLAELDRRIEAVLGVARKFRCGPEDLPGLLTRWQERLAVLGDAADIAGLTARVASTRQQYEQLAQRLSGSRAMAADERLAERSARSCSNWRSVAVASRSACCRLTEVMLPGSSRSSSALPDWPAANRGPWPRSRPVARSRASVLPFRWSPVKRHAYQRLSLTRSMSVSVAAWPRLSVVCCVSWEPNGRSSASRICHRWLHVPTGNGRSARFPKSGTFTASRCRA